jgi:ribokinase
VAAIAARGVPNAIVTLGSDGCLALSGGRYVEVDGFPVEVLDSTGAGGAFVGALGVALARGDELPDAVRYAAAAGALACRHLGAKHDGIREAEVEKLLRGVAEFSQPSIRRP